LRQGVAFVKGSLKRLPQGDDTWEADFRALPKPIDQSVTHYRGMVVCQADGSLLAESEVHGRPSVNDLATLLANAMRRPLDGDARRPRLARILRPQGSSSVAFAGLHTKIRSRLGVFPGPVMLYGPEMVTPLACGGLPLFSGT